MHNTSIEDKANGMQPDIFTHYGTLYPAPQSGQLLQRLLQETPWQTEFLSFGRRFAMPRLQAWYADEGIEYRYAENQLQSHHWNDCLLDIKHDIEAATGLQFNSVLLTCYRDGHDYVGWHADDEAELGTEPVIASLSLGAVRQFHYRHKQSTASGAVPLHDGELLIMHPCFQQHWVHAIHPEPAVLQPRLNLTFRRVLSPHAVINAD